MVGNGVDLLERPRLHELDVGIERARVEVVERVDEEVLMGIDLPQLGALHQDVLLAVGVELAVRVERATCELVICKHVVPRLVRGDEPFDYQLFRSEGHRLNSSRRIASATFTRNNR